MISLKQAQGLCGCVPCPLCIYYSFLVAVFMGLLEHVGFWFFCLLLDLFPFIWFPLFFFYFILFCYVLLSLRSLLFSYERQREVEPDGREGREELEGLEGGQTVIGIYCLREESIFNEMKKNCKNKNKDVRQEIPSIFKSFKPRDKSHYYSTGLAI